MLLLGIDFMFPFSMEAKKAVYSSGGTWNQIRHRSNSSSELFSFGFYVGHTDHMQETKWTSGNTHMHSTIIYLHS